MSSPPPSHTGITTGTAAAAAGGVTTLVDMPLNSFPVTTVRSRLEEKQKLAEVSVCSGLFSGRCNRNVWNKQRVDNSYPNCEVYNV
jgi:allantoinase